MRRLPKRNMKYWEIVADRLGKSGWSWGVVAVIGAKGQRIFVVDAHRNDGKRYVIRADDKLSAFLEIETVIRETDFHRG